jgi:SAM-dependent methyltransferase
MLLRWMRGRAGGSPRTLRCVSEQVTPVNDALPVAMSALNLGCGFDHLDGYVDLDLYAFHRPDVVADVRALPMAADSVRDVLARDVLEHLGRDDSDTVLAECARVLCPGGTLRVQVPDLAGVGRHLQGDDLDLHQRAAQLVYGTQAYAGDFHLSGFTDLLLADRLGRAGFDRAEIWTIDGWLLEALATAPAGSVPTPHAVSFGESWYLPEFDARSRWRWARPGATVRLLNPSEETAVVSWCGRWVTHSSHDGEIILCDAKGNEVVTCPAGPPPGALFAIRLDVPPGVLTLHLSGDIAPWQPASSGDGRDLYVALADSLVTAGG